MKHKTLNKVTLFLLSMFVIFVGNRSLNTSMEPFGSLYSENVILLPLDSKKPTYTKKEQERIAPASLTKIMTAIIVIENSKDLQDTATISEHTMQTMLLNNASTAGYVTNESATILDLLYGLMLSSGGECGLTLAQKIAGSEASFVALMNQKAKELQLTNTQYTNVDGFDDASHYSSVKDIATLLQYALKNTTFYTIFTSLHYLSSSTIYHPDGISFVSTLVNQEIPLAIPNGSILGGKTGYTENAGLCLASLAKINDMYYILVSANADGDHTTEPYHILDALTIYKKL